MNWLTVLDDPGVLEQSLINNLSFTCQFCPYCLTVCLFKTVLLRLSALFQGWNCDGSTLVSLRRHIRLQSVDWLSDAYVLQEMSRVVRNRWFQSGVRFPKASLANYGR